MFHLRHVIGSGGATFQTNPKKNSSGPVVQNVALKIAPERVDPSRSNYRYYCNAPLVVVTLALATGFRAL